MEQYKLDLARFFMDLKDSHGIKLDRYMADSNKNVMNYTIGHLPRIWAGVQMIKKLKPYRWTILEAGSPYPFMSFYFYLHENCVSVSSDLYDRKWNVNVDLSFRKINLCTDLPIEEKYDLVIASEVFEHLPCNLGKVRDQLYETATKAVLFSFPMKSMAKDSLFEDVKDPKEFTKAHGHLREFKGLVDDFVCEFNVIDTKVVHPPAYGGDIKLVLIKK